MKEKVEGFNNVPEVAPRAARELFRTRAIDLYCSILTKKELLSKRGLKDSERKRIITFCVLNFCGLRSVKPKKPEKLNKPEKPEELSSVPSRPLRCSTFVSFCDSEPEKPDKLKKPEKIKKPEKRVSPRRLKSSTKRIHLPGLHVPVKRYKIRSDTDINERRNKDGSENV